MTRVEGDTNGVIRVSLDLFVWVMKDRGSDGIEPTEEEIRATLLWTEENWQTLASTRATSRIQAGQLMQEKSVPTGLSKESMQLSASLARVFT